MTMRGNWTTYFAARLESVFSFSNTPVYSNLDPNRDYNGGCTVEVQESGAPVVTTFISGRTVQTRTFIIACRAPTQEGALEMAQAAKAVIADVLKIWEDGGAISGAFFEDMGTEADDRGIVTGESFYGYVTFKFTEDGDLPQ